MKRNAMGTYAIANRQKYESIAKKSLTMPELIQAAKPDWDAEDQEVKERYKRIAKGIVNPNAESSHLTRSYNSYDDIQVTVEDIDSATIENAKKRVESSSKYHLEKMKALTNDDIINHEIGIIDIATFGQSCYYPAEICFNIGTIKSGLLHKLHEILAVNHFLRKGFLAEALVSMDQHGIYVKEDGGKTRLTNFIAELKEFMRTYSSCVILVRKVDLRKVTGVWQWLKLSTKCSCKPPCSTGHENIPDLKLVVMEDFIQCMIESKSNEQVAVTQIERHLDNPRHDFEMEYRCDFHNEEAHDKVCCAMKNTFKYFFLLSELIKDCLDLEIVVGKHYPNSPSDRKQPRSGRQRQPLRWQAKSAAKSAPSTVFSTDRVNFASYGRGRGRATNKGAVNHPIGGDWRRPNSKVKKKDSVPAGDEISNEASAGANYNGAYTNSPDDCGKDVLRPPLKAQKKENFDSHCLSSTTNEQGESDGRYMDSNNDHDVINDHPNLQSRETSSARDENEYRPTPLMLSIKEEAGDVNNQPTPEVPPGFELESPVSTINSATSLCVISKPVLKPAEERDVAAAGRRKKRGR